MSRVRHFLMIGGSAMFGALILLVLGIPGAILLVLTPVFVCVGLTLAMGRGDPDGAGLLESARRAVRPPQE